MENVELKIVSIVFIFLVGVAGGWAALRMDRRDDAEVLFSFGSSFAGGIFLGAGLIHLLPDAVDGFNTVFGGLDYPLAPLITASACIVILLVEKILLAEKPVAETGPEAISAGRLSSYTLAIVLSVHAVLAGAAFGADGSLLGSLVILIAILAHKGSAAFALAVDLYRGGLSGKSIFKFIIFFALTTPLGVLMGLGFDAALSSTSGRLFEAVFDALAAGTFIYIASLDIIVEEFSSLDRIWTKFVLLCMGLGLMGLIAVWA